MGTLTLLAFSCQCEEFMFYQKTGNQRYINPDFFFLEKIEGHIITFDDGFKFAYDRYIDEGNTTKILFGRQYSPGVFYGENMALRVPKNSSMFQYIDGTLKGVKILQALGARIPRIYSAKISQYIALEYIAKYTSFTEILLEPETISIKYYAQMEREFLDFLLQLAPLERLSDFHSEQLVYSVQKGVVLLDWSSDHKIRKRGNPKTIFSGRFLKALLTSMHTKNISREGRRNAYNRIREYESLILTRQNLLDLLELKSLKKIGDMVNGGFLFSAIKNEILAWPALTTEESMLDLINLLKENFDGLRERGMTLHDLADIRTRHTIHAENIWWQLSAELERMSHESTCLDMAAFFFAS